MLNHADTRGEDICGYTSQWGCNRLPESGGSQVVVARANGPSCLELNMKLWAANVLTDTVRQEIPTKCATRHVTLKLQLSRGQNWYMPHDSARNSHMINAHIHYTSCALQCVLALVLTLSVLVHSISSVQSGLGPGSSPR